MVYKALTIAGSDSGGGAGIQADLKTFHQFHVFGMSAITAVTAQNTLGVQGIYPLPVEAVEKQMDSIAVDLSPDAIKTGMLFSEDMIECVAYKIKQHRWTRVVVDPVMVAKGGSRLLKQEAVEALQRHMLPLAYVLTPNIPEAEVLTNMRIETLEQRKEAAKKLHDMGVKYVVMKGGHGEGNELVDLLYDGEQFYEWKSKRVHTKHTHGTGCTFAAAITAQLAKEKTIYEAVDVAKRFIQAAIEQTLHIGGGHGPTNHWAFHE